MKKSTHTPSDEKPCMGFVYILTNPSFREDWVKIGKSSLRRFADDIAWESEVWIADNPDHMIYFNGYKFLEIHK